LPKYDDSIPNLEGLYGYEQRKKEERLLEMERLVNEENERKEKLKIVEASIFKDDFTKQYSISITKVANVDQAYIPLRSCEDNPGTLWITFKYTTSFYMHLTSSFDFFKMKQGHNIHFLFEDDSVLELSFRISSRMDGKGVYSNVLSISDEDLMKFYKLPLSKVKITGTHYDVLSFVPMLGAISVTPYKTFEEGQDLLRLMIKKFIGAVVQHGNDTGNIALTKVINL
jgi:hypothetical protein